MKKMPKKIPVTRNGKEIGMVVSYEPFSGEAVMQIYPEYSELFLKLMIDGLVGVFLRSIPARRKNEGKK